MWFQSVRTMWFRICAMPSGYISVFTALKIHDGQQPHAGRLLQLTRAHTAAVSKIRQLIKHNFRTLSHDGL